MLGRKLGVLVLASLAGFAARGGSAASPAAVIRSLLVLFVVVFLGALVLSALSDHAANQPAPEAGGIRQGHSDSPQVSHATAYETP